MSTRLLALIATELESDAGASTSANPTVTGYWKRIAAALEALAGASTSANTNLSGYMLRSALAAEVIGGTTGGENSTEAGYLKRIVEAFEAENAETYTGSWLERFRLAVIDYTAGAPTGITAPILTQLSADGAQPFNWSINFPDDTIAAGMFIRTQTSADGIKDVDGAYVTPTQNLLQQLVPGDFEDSDLSGSPDLVITGFSTPSGLFYLQQRIEQDDEIATINSPWSNELSETIVVSAAKFFTATGVNKSQYTTITNNDLTATCHANLNAPALVRATLEAANNQFHIEFLIVGMDRVSATPQGNFICGLTDATTNFNTSNPVPGITVNIPGFSARVRHDQTTMSVGTNNAATNHNLPGVAIAANGDAIILEVTVSTGVVNVYYYRASTGISTFIVTKTIAGIYIPADYYAFAGGYRGHLAAPNKDSVTMNPGSSAWLMTPNTGFTYYA